MHGESEAAEPDAAAAAASPATPDAATPDAATPDAATPVPAAATFRLGARAHWHPTANLFFIGFMAFVPALVLGMALRPFFHPMLGIAMGIVLAVFVALWPEVTIIVGADGLSLGRRFFGWADIQSVSRGEHFARGIVELIIRLRSGEVLQLFCMVPLRETVLAEIVAMRARYDAAFRELDTSALRRSRRGGATDAEWVRDLRAVGAGARIDHRTAPVSEDELWTAIECAGVEPEVRAAAAIAVSTALDDDGRARLRDAAKATASKKLRIALEAVALDRDEEALAEALAALELERPRRLRA